MKLLVTVLLSCGLLATQAQRHCGTSNYWQQQIHSDALLAARYKQIEAPVKRPDNISSKEQGGDATSPLITIPVVIHVLYNTEEQNISNVQIQDQLDVLNKDFGKLNADLQAVPAYFAIYAANAQIKFELAKVDPEGRATKAVIRKKTDQLSWPQNDRMKFNTYGGDDAWDSRYYLNIWVCNLGDGLLGYSSFPGASAEKDGIVIRSDIFGVNSNHSPYNKGRTLTHETGHWLNLKHLWGDTDCGNDNVDDTPPQKTYSSGCPSFPQINSGSCNQNPSGDMFMNFMDFSDDACMHMFTYGQKERMQALFSDSGPRASILQSPALGTPWNVTDQVVSGIDATQAYRLFPNPATTTITFLNAAGKLVTPVYYTIYNISGSPVLSGNNRSKVEIHRLTAGIYAVRLQLDGEQVLLKFVKQ